MAIIQTEAQLEAIYGKPGPASLVKEINFISPLYREIIAASPFLALATVGPEGIDCSPRGDRRGELVRIIDERTLALPDRRGNNRIDSLRNLVRDPRVALMFMVPGYRNVLRVNGRAHLDVTPALLDDFAVEGHAPRSVIMVSIDAIYFQCARALIRSNLWDPAHFVAHDSMPTAGAMLAELSDNRVGGAAYDAEWPERAKNSMW